MMKNTNWVHTGKETIRKYAAVQCSSCLDQHVISVVKKMHTNTLDQFALQNLAEFIVLKHIIAFFSRASIYPCASHILIDTSSLKKRTGIHDKV